MSTAQPTGTPTGHPSGTPPGQPHTDAKPRRLPILRGILPLPRGQITGEIVAGLSLAALAIPSAMGYTKIAGMPVVTGLYTILLPLALFALFGASRHLVVGADSATAAVMAAGLVGLAVPGSPEYVALAGLLAVLAAALLVVARLVRLGFLADFLSRTVLIGFLTGVGIQVALDQINEMLGLPAGTGGPLVRLLGVLGQLPQANLYAVGIALAVLAIIVGLDRINRRIPGALVAVVGAIAVSYGLDLAAKGVALIGPVAGGLPSLALPRPQVDWDSAQRLLVTSFSLLIVILAQSAATVRAYAARYRERTDENMDMIGLSLANLGAGLTGAFVVNGSPTKTQMVDRAGGRTQLAQLVTAGIVLLVLLFLTGPLAYLPRAVLAAIVFLIGVEMIDYRGMRSILAQRPAEFWVALATTATVVIVGVEQGILLAIALSLISHTRHGYKPRNTVLDEREGRLYAVPVTDATQIVPGMVAYRFNHSMYYANAGQMEEEIMTLVRLGPAPVRWFCIDLVAVDDIDFTAAATLHDLVADLAKDDIRVVFVNASEHVRKELERSQITTPTGQGTCYRDTPAAIAAFQAALTRPASAGNVPANR